MEYPTSKHTSIICNRFNFVLNETLVDEINEFGPYKMSFQTTSCASHPDFSHDDHDTKIPSWKISPTQCHTRELSCS